MSVTITACIKWTILNFHLTLSDFFAFINGALIVEEANRTVQVCAKYTLTRIVEFNTSLTLATSDGTGMCVQHLALLNHTI